MNWEPSRITDHHIQKIVWKTFASNFKIPLHFLGVPSQSVSQFSLTQAEIHPNCAGKFSNFLQK